MSSFDTLVISAPAKVILHGEHSVVYGKAAIAASLDLRTTLSWRKSEEIRLVLTDLGYQKTWSLNQIQSLPLFTQGSIREMGEVSSDVIEIFKTFIHEQSKDISDVAFSASLTFLLLYKMICDKNKRLIPGTYEIKSEIPVGAGLGSSASYCVVVVTCLLIQNGFIEPDFRGTEEESSSLELINHWAFQGEKVIHGNPSGIDNTTNTYGGFLQYEDGSKKNLKSVFQLDILLINTNIPRRTKKIVSDLRTRYLQIPSVYKPIFEAMGAISEEAIKLLCCNSDKTIGDYAPLDYYDKLKKLVDLNQDLLKAIGVSHKVIEEVCAKTSEHGFHSKLTGAGGGGCVITLIPTGVDANLVNKVCEELKQMFGCTCWRTKLGGNGVMVHEWC